MGYIENPKTKNSGIICCIPQTGTCPNNCDDCFFQTGRSYLEPLDKNLPNMPSLEETGNKIVRVNDGNDSNVKRKKVIEATKQYKQKFYNTAIPKNLEEFDAPVVLTINPAKMTDLDVYLLDEIPKNLMFVRIRTNMWNINLVDKAIDWYSKKEIPIILTFMAYFKETIPNGYESWYVYRKRTTNSYWAITFDGWNQIMNMYQQNKWVYSCGKFEGEVRNGGCRHCGNCLREYFAVMEKLK